MPKREKKLYIADILDSAAAIKEFTTGMSFEDFIGDRKTYSATIREYIIIGEAKQSDRFAGRRVPAYPWRMVKDFRNLIVHEYFGVDARVVWDLTTLELDELVKHIRNLEIKDR
ncbi:HepT-like ribonuclease domain-containing protein [Nitratifractor sp.]